MAFTVDVKAALVFVVAIPLLSLVVFGIMLITMPLYRKVQSDLDAVLGITRENLTGVRVIRAFNKEADEKQRFEQQNQMLTDAQKFVGKISGLMNPVTYIIVNGALIVLIYVGALRVDAGIYYPGTGSSTGKLYVTDSGGTGEAGQSDYYGDQSICLRQPYSECF